MNAFRTYVLRRRIWRKSSIQPHVAEFDTFATRAYWLTSMRSPVHAQRGIRQPPVNHSENSIRLEFCILSERKAYRLPDRPFGDRNARRNSGASRQVDHVII